MEVSVAVEQRRPLRETPAQRFGREIGSFFTSIARMTMLALLLMPVLLAAFLTVDVPVRGFDQNFDVETMKPSHWLNLGGLFMALGAPLAILYARRYGGDEASRAITAAWGLAAVATFAELSYLAPTLAAEDFPSVRFVIAFVASAMIGQYVAVSIYDVIRGGGPWWRAPAMAALFGFGAHIVVYFPVAYWSSGAPWFNWMVADFAAKAIIAFAFLPVYWLLQKSFRPLSGLGGR
jgi:uncharacterized PurR-regulated membrane protein YhhQ (DUF165 family)